MASGPVEVAVEPPIGWLYFNRPDKLNAMNTEMLEAAAASLRELGSRGDVSFIAVSGRGRAFSAGIDLGEVAAASTPEEAARPFRSLARLLYTLLESPKVTIAAVNGHAVGGGAELLWAFDIVVAVRGARISWPEARWGLVPPALATIGPSVLGPARAGLLALTSGSLTAEEAYELGLVSVLAGAPEDLPRAVREVAARVAENSPDAVAAAARLLRRWKAQVLLDLGVAELERLSRSTATVEAARSFVERRAPPRYRWPGAGHG